MTADRYVDINELAQLTPIAESTFRSWRHRGVGPRSYKLGRRVVYRLSEVEAWLDEQAQTTARGGAA